MGGGSRGGGRGKRQPSPLDAGYDRWLDRQLHGYYDPVLDEKLPDDLLKVIAKFDARDPKDGSKGS